MRDSQPTISRVSYKNKDIDSLRVHKLGQIAFAKYLISKGKTQSAMKDVFSEWTDFETADGEKLYVCATRLPGRISVQTTKVHDAKILIYISVYIVEDEKMAYIKGFATADEMQESGIVVKEDSLGKSYKVYERDWAQLKPISVLLSKSSYFRLTGKTLYSPEDLWFRENLLSVGKSFHLTKRGS